MFAFHIVFFGTISILALPVFLMDESYACLFLAAPFQILLEPLASDGRESKIIDRAIFLRKTTYFQIGWKAFVPALGAVLWLYGAKFVLNLHWGLAAIPPVILSVVVSNRFLSELRSWLLHNDEVYNLTHNQ